MIADADPDPQGDRRGWANDTSLFASRVVWVFATRILQFGLNFATIFLIAAILGAAPSGEFTLLLTWIGMLYALGQLGMPAAMTFLAGRGRSLVSLERIGLWLTVALSLAIALVAIAALPLLERTVLQALAGGQVTTSDELLRAALLALPMQFLTQFGSGILYTRGHNRVFNLIQVAEAAALVVLTLVLIGFAPYGVPGALTAYLVVNGVAAAAVAYQVHRLARRPEGSVGADASIGEFAHYGLRLYPQNITSFFSYRADVLLLSWMLGDLRIIGLYGLAVRIAETTFYVPDSISAMLYPAISASSKREADRLATSAARFTMLATSLAVLVIVPAGVVAILVLPHDFLGAIPPLLIIMPGILSLSLSKVLAAYVSGLGRPVPTAIAATIALAINLAVNVTLIPAWGIAGAAAASLVSYTSQALVLLWVASRWTGVGPLQFVVPRGAEVDRLRRTIRDGITRVRALASR